MEAIWKNNAHGIEIAAGMRECGAVILLLPDAAAVAAVAAAITSLRG